MTGDKLKFIPIGRDKYYAISSKSMVNGARYLEVPIDTDSIFINDKQVFSADFFGHETYDEDLVKSLLPIGSAVYVPIIKDLDSVFAKKTYDIIGTLSDIDLLRRTITIALDSHKDEEVKNILSEIDDNTFHYYAGLHMHIRMENLKLVRDTRKEAQVSLLRISNYDDEMRAKAKAKHDSKWDLTFSSSSVVFKDYSTNKIINNIDDPNEYSRIVKDIGYIHENTNVFLLTKNFEDTKEFIGTVREDYELPFAVNKTIHFDIDPKKEKDIKEKLSHIKELNPIYGLIVPVKKYQNNEPYIIDKDQNLYVDLIKSDLDKITNKIREMTKNTSWDKDYKAPEKITVYTLEAKPKSSRASKVTVIKNRTTLDPLTCMGEMAGVCWGADTSDPEKNYKRGLSCLKSNHGRVLEYAQVYMVLHDSSIKVFRDYYTHIGGGPSRLQDSTRRKDMTTDFKYITPHTIAANPEALKIFTDQMESARQAEIKLEKLGIPREDASGVLPLETDSTVVVRTNLRQLIEMSHQRMCTRAYWEFREIMDDMVKQLGSLSDEWKYIVDNYFVPKCEVLGYCPEAKSCGRKPKKED